MKTILLCDDEECILEILSEEIKFFPGPSFVTVLCSTPAQVEAYLSEHTPDYVISDYSMLNKDMGFLGLLGIPIVFYTGRILDVPEGIGGGEILFKPDTTENIMHSLFRQANAS